MIAILQILTNLVSIWGTLSIHFPHLVTWNTFEDIYHCYEAKINPFIGEGLTKMCRIYYPGTWYPSLLRFPIQSHQSGGRKAVNQIKTIFVKVRRILCNIIFKLITYDYLHFTIIIGPNQQSQKYGVIYNVDHKDRMTYSASFTF